MAKVGRPTDFTPELGDDICERICDGESLRSICSDEDMPNRATVFRWIAKHEEFRDQYAQSREAQAEVLADEIMDISDDGSNDWMERKNADGENIGWSVNGEAIQRSKLRVDSRKWVASKLLPKKYGEKLDIKHDGKIDSNADTDPRQLARAILSVLGDAKIDDEGTEE
jgi:hypothetical protein